MLTECILYVAEIAVVFDFILIYCFCATITQPIVETCFNIIIRDISLSCQPR